MSTRLALVSTFPGTQCGIATFSQALSEHLELAGVEVGVVRLVEGPTLPRAPVIHSWVTGEGGTGLGQRAEAAARALDSYDAVLLQHEYGIFGGADGQDVLELVRRLRVPMITVLHTVLTTPSPNQYRVLAELVAASSALVTMTRTARDRLVEVWGVSPDLVTVIAHGALDNRGPGASNAGPGDGVVVLTWGLISPGKGIEWAIMAMAELRDRGLLPTYRIVGQTHPRVLERDGEVYRHSLEQLVGDLGLEDSIEFVPTYLDGDALRAVVRQSDIVLLPYDSLDQVTSGVLAEAVAAGRPVVSTSFPHAVELLSDGAGILVPRKDPAAIAAALGRLLTDADLARTTAQASRALATSMLWPAVAQCYLELSLTCTGEGYVDARGAATL